MTVQQWFRGRGFDSAIGRVVLRRSVAISLPPAGLGRTLVAVGGAALLVALALWASAGTAVAVVAVGVGVTAWGWQRAQQRKRPDLAHRKGPDLARDERAPFWSPVPASAAASGSLRSPRTLPALLTAETGLTKPQARAEQAWCTDPPPCGYWRASPARPSPASPSRWPVRSWRAGRAGSRGREGRRRSCPPPSMRSDPC